MFLIYLILLCGFFNLVSSVTLNLGGNDWLIASNNISVSASVPGEVHSALFKQGLIRDPLFRFNDVENRWVSLSNWTYAKKFNVSKADLDYQQIELVCEGLDTVAEIILNDQSVGLVKNMFRRYTFNIKHLLKTTTSNHLVITFLSPVQYAKQQANSYPYPVPPQCPPSVQHGECSYNFIRKAAYSFSWDWGPSYPSIGIWKDLFLRMYNRASIEYVTSEAVLDKSVWKLRVGTFLRVSDESVGKSVKLSVSLSQLNATHEDVVVLKATHQRHDIHFLFNSSSIKLWWPYGMGEQALYNVVVNMRQISHNEDEDDDDNEICGPDNDLQLLDLDSKSIKVGFRTVELVQDHVKEDGGLTFYFSINNQPLFLKGSNWIPVSNFLTNQTTEQYDWLLRSSIDAHMNVMRVWGGGVYETEEFYEKADELGIMIWQDFMFACALYPTNQEFLDDVRHEVTHQVRRLKHHPSIIIWSGNNENEGVLANNWYGITPDDYPKYKADYVKLYVDVIRDVILREDMDRPFIPSSPTNGLQSIKEGWVATNPQDVKYGDIHFYDYNMDGWLPSLYLSPRMASEFGIQSWSSVESLLDVSWPNEDWKLMGEFAMHRQHHTNGETEIFNEINEHFEFNKTSDNATKHFIDYVYLSQINQAMSVKTQVEHYRRNGCNITLDNPTRVGVCKDGGTMGALYWQLNDVWQAPTWSSIEHNGKWKLLHYYAQNFFNSYLVSPVIKKDVQSNDDIILFHSIVDHIHLADVNLMISNLSLIVSCYQIDRFDVPKNWNIQFNQKTSHKVAFQIKMNSLLNECQCKNKGNCFLKTKMITNTNDKSVILSENILFLTTYIDYKLLPRANVLVKDIKLVDEKTTEISIETNAYAYFVQIEAYGVKGKFSDNGFLLTEKSRIITFTAQNPIYDVNLFRRCLKITTLNDVYV